MKCKYEYKGEKYDSYQDAIDAAIISGEKDLNLIFYSGNVNLKEFIQKLSNDSKNMAGKFIPATQVVNQIVEGTKGKLVLEGINEVKRSFQQDFGNKLHDCLRLKTEIIFYNDEKSGQSKDKLSEQLVKQIDELALFIRDFKDNKNYKELSEEDQMSFNKSISLINFPTSNNVEIITNLINNIGKDVIGNVSHAFSELPIKTTGVSAKFLSDYGTETGDKIDGISAKLDLLSIITKNGQPTLLITDYKTKISQNDSNKYAVQLELYKEILKSHGVDLPITNQIVEIYYTNDPSDPIKFSTNIATLDKQTMANSRVRPLFKGINIDVNKIAEIQKKSNAVLNDLYTNARLKKWNIDEFIDYMSSRKTWSGLRSTKKLIKSIDKEGNKINFTNGDSENLRTWAEEEIKAGNSFKAGRVNTLIENLSECRISPDRIKNLVKNKRVTTDRFYKNLQKYTMGDWKYVSHPGLEENGVIVMQNLVDGSFDFVVLSNSNIDFNHSVTMQFGSSLLGDVISDIELQKTKQIIPENSVANIIRMKTLALINLFSDTFDSKIKISEIKIIDPSTGKIAPTRNLNDFQNTLRLAKTLKSKNVVISDKISFEDNRVRLFKFVSDFAKKYNIGIDNTIVKKSFPIQIEELRKVLKEIEKEYPSEINPDRSSNQIITEIQELYSWIGHLIVTLSGYDTDEQYHASTMGIKSENIFGMSWSLLRTGQAKKFAKNGYVLTGLGQGIDMSVTYANPDIALDAVSRQHRVAMAKSRRDLEAQGLEINKATTEFLNASISKISQAIIGYNKSAYACLFQTNDGKLDNSMRLKKPDDSSLAPFQKEYLEIMLWTFNKYRMPSNVISDSDRNKTFAEFKYTAGYDKYLTALKESDKWLNYPLRKAKNASIIMSKFGSSRAIKQTWSDMIDNFQKLVDPRNMFDEQKKKQEELEKSLTMYNQYSETEDDRAELLEKRGPENFELNMNIVALDYIFSNIKEKYYNEAMEIDSYIIGTIRLLELQTGEDYSSTIQTINDRVKVDLYGKNLTDPDLEEPTKVITSLRAIGSAIKIGGRPVLFAKEMTSSLLKIIAKSSLGYFQNENLSSKEILQAYSKVFGTSLEHMGNKALNKSDLGDFSLIGSINRIYGIANFDMNIVPEKFAADRYGLYNVTKQLLYTTSTAPDFYNRMAIFVACMIKDGCYDAHKINENGEVVYDISKDERFSEFWKHRKDKNYKSEKFNEQYALYEWTVRQFNAEGYNLTFGEEGPDGELIFDPLPMAYTNLQRDSMKESIGTVLGMYDHEESETSRQKTFSIYFRQFQTYLSGEIKKYFATGHQTTAKGRPELKRDNEGNIIYIEGYDEYGKVIETTKNKDGSLKPMYEWKGHPVEGLIISFLGTMHDMFSEDFREKIKNGSFEEKQRLANAKVFLFNLLFAYFIAQLLAWMWGGGDEKNIPDELVPAYTIMKDRVSQEFSPWQSIAQPVLGLNIVGLNYAQDFAKDVSKVITRDDYGILNVMYDNISAFKDTGYMENK